MKESSLLSKSLLLAGLLCGLGLTSCYAVSDGGEAREASSKTSGEVSEVSEVSKVNEIAAEITAETGSDSKALALGKYTFDELRNAGEPGGCGMTLLEPRTNWYEDGIYFFRGLGSNTAAAPAYVEINDEIVPFVQTSASGEAFYGQQTMQTFESEDGSVTLQVEVTLGEKGEIESVEFSEGTITIESEGQTTELPVAGGAGC